MTITFENDNKVIVYALEKIIAYARNNRYIFLPQSVWWISLIIGLHQGLVTHIDNLRIRSNVSHIESQPGLPVDSKLSIAAGLEVPDLARLGCSVHPSRVGRICTSSGDFSPSESDSGSTTQTNIHNEVVENRELFLEQSKQERKAIGRKNRQASRVLEKRANKKKPVKTFGTETEGMDGNKLRRRKAAGECQRCAWPRDRKGSHKTIDCFPWKKLEKGTAPFPKKKTYNKD